MSSGKKFVVTGDEPWVKDWAGTVLQEVGDPDNRTSVNGVVVKDSRVVVPASGTPYSFYRKNVRFLPDEAGAKVGRKFVITGYSLGWEGVKCLCWNITGDDIHGDVLEGRGDICSAGARVIFNRRNTRFLPDEPKFKAGDRVTVTPHTGGGSWVDVVKKVNEYNPEVVLLQDFGRWVNTEILTAQPKFTNATTPPAPKFEKGDRVVGILCGGVAVAGIVERASHGGVLIKADNDTPRTYASIREEDVAKLPTFPEPLVIGADRPAETKMQIVFSHEGNVVKVSLVGPGDCGTLSAGIHLGSPGAPSALIVRLGINPALATNKCQPDCDNPTCGIGVASDSMDALFVWVRRLACELIKVKPEDWAATVRRIYDEDARRITVIGLRSRQLPL